jgi:hypothetical protein
MANNYLEFSETLVDLTREEETWLREQLEIVYVYGDREYTEEAILRNEVEEDLRDTEEDWYGCRVFRDLPEYDPEDGTPVGFEHEFLGDEDAAGEDRYLWFHVEEGGYPDRVAHLVQKFLQKFRPDQYWTLSYATTCSKPRAGEFGGGCVFVTATKIEWCTTWDFLEAHIEAFREEPTPTPADFQHPLRTYKLAIDGPAFQAQRQRLIEVASALHQGETVQLGPTDAEPFEGLVNLTDAIADQAADRYRIDALLPVVQEQKMHDTEDGSEPEDRLARLVADLGLADEDIDEIVHHVASEIASDINNGGVLSQIKYLLAQLGEEGTERDLRILAERKGESREDATDG